MKNHKVVILIFLIVLFSILFNLLEYPKANFNLIACGCCFKNYQNYPQLAAAAVPELPEPNPAVAWLVDSV